MLNNSSFSKNRMALLLAFTLIVSCFVPVSANAEGEGQVFESTMELATNTQEIIVSDTVKIRSLSSDFTQPSAFLTKKKIVLNGMRKSVSDDTYLVLDVDGDYEISGLSGTGGLLISAVQCSFNSLPAFHITVSAGSSTARGTSRKNIVVTDKKSGAKSKPVKLLISVGKKNPVARWKKSMVTLNCSVKGDFAVNSPDIEGVTIAPLSGNRYKPKIPPGVNVSLINENTVKIKAGSGMKVNKSYPVVLWFIYADSSDVRFVKKKFSVKLIEKESFMTFKKSGDSSDVSLHYTPVIKNTGMVLRELDFMDKSLSKNYILETVKDPGTGEISDVFVSSGDGTAIKGKGTVFSFNAFLGNAGIDAGTVKKNPSFSASGKPYRVGLSFVSGNKLMTNVTLSDNKVSGSLEIRANSSGYAKIDPASIKSLTADPAFKTYWIVDSNLRAARLTVVADKNKLKSGKTYTLSYAIKAKGAPSSAPATKIKVRYKAV